MRLISSCKLSFLIVPVRGLQVASLLGGSFFLTQRHRGTEKNFNAEVPKDTEGLNSASSVFHGIPSSPLRASVPPCETPQKIREWLILIFVSAILFAVHTACAAQILRAEEIAEKLAVAEIAAVENSESILIDERFATFLGQRRRKNSYGGGGGVWGNAYFGNTSLDASIAGLSGKVSPDILGFQLGYDKRFATARLSFYYNYGNTFTAATFSGVELLRWKTEDHLLGLVFSNYGQMSHLVLVGNVGYDKHNMSKFGIDISDGKAHGAQASIYGELGLDLLLSNPTWALKPFSALKYNYLLCGDIDYAGGKIPIPDSQNHSLTWLNGVRCNKRLNNSLELQARVVWLHQLLEEYGKIDNFNFSFVNSVMTPTQFLILTDPGADRVWLGCGIKWYVGYTDIRMFADYDFTFNAKQATHLGSLGFLLAW